MNAVLERLYAQRDEQVATMDAILARVEADGRDLVDAERNLLEAARQRIGELDAQITPLEEFEALRSAHADGQARIAPRSPAVPDTRPAGSLPAPTYASPGAFLADYCRAQGCRPGGAFAEPDPQAAARVAQARAIANQTTADTAGILPTMIVGQVVNLIDANRPLVQSLGGAMALGGIPGLSFSRPKVTQHAQVGKQTAEKAELPSRQMRIQPITFTKETYGGTVDISRQDIDWTSPAAWDILVRDLADVYAIQTEEVIAAAFATAAAANAAEVVETDDLAGWAIALYKAAARSYSVNKRMPDRLWVSLDMWAALGPLVDLKRLMFPPPGMASSDMAAGSSELSSFAGDVIGLPRIVVPTFPEGTAIIGNSGLYEVYEEVIGLLSVVEPSVLGVTVAYGGYVAYGAVEAGGLIPLEAPAAPEPEPEALRGGGGAGAANRTAPARR